MITEVPIARIAMMTWPLINAYTSFTKLGLNLRGTEDGRNSISDFCSFKTLLTLLAYRLQYS